MYKFTNNIIARAYHLDNEEDNFKKHYEKGQQQRETEVRLER